MASSIEMSFSLSRLRSTPRSMSIGLYTPYQVRAALVRRLPVVFELAELHLNLPRPQFRVAELPAFPVDLDEYPGWACFDHPALDSLSLDPDPDEPPGRPPPVPRFGERAVHPGGRDLERVRAGAHRVGRVDLGGDGPADHRYVVQAHTVLAVHHHAQQAAAACPADPDGLEFEPGGADHRLDKVGQVFRTYRSLTGASAHHDLLARRLCCCLKKLSQNSLTGDRAQLEPPGYQDRLGLVLE